MSRSLKVGREYLKKVKLALLRGGFPSQRALALDLGLALSTVSRFCTGKSVDYGTFVDICEKLSLEWKDIADLNHNIATQSIKSSVAKQQSSSITDSVNIASIPKDLPFPEGAVPPNSAFYQERKNIESVCWETIIKPGCLIRIKAPKLMGKTSLTIKVLAYAQSQGYQTVYLDIRNVDRSIVTDLDKFLRWLCAVVGKQLGLENQLNDYWDLDILGSNGNCTAYFEEYLLPRLNLPLVLGLDDIDRLFPYEAIIEDFLGMLRSWHEKGKIFPIWQNLRLVMAHSTEVYIPLDLNQSPFNAGVPIELLELSLEEIENLAKLHQLDWDRDKTQKLLDILGGHPYLIRLAMYHLAQDKISWETLLENAAQEIGIYSNHLRRQLDVLQQKSSLVESFKQVVNANEAIDLNPIAIYQLYSMGLVKLQGNQVIPSCQLYRDYFSRVL